MNKNDSLRPLVGRYLKTLAVAGSAIAASFAMTQTASAGLITPDIIWGSGNTNRGFEVTTVGSLELGMRAKLRYASPNDVIGVGIIQNGAGDYLFDSAANVAPANRAIWNFDWGINSDIDGNGGTLDTFSYLISFDSDSSAAVSFNAYDPFSATSTGAYLGTNATGNGAAAFSSPGTGDLTANNVAQNSVNYGFLGDFGPLGDGEYAVKLEAFDLNGGFVGSSEINVIVGPGVGTVPVPGVLALMLAGMGGLVLTRRRAR